MFEPQIRQEYRDYLAGKARISSIPRDKESNLAAYGVNPKGKGQGEALYGPVDWEQFFPTWDTVGQEYKEESWKTRHGWNPMIAKHMKFLKDKGFIFEKKLGEGAFGQVWKVRATKLKQKNIGKGKVEFEPVDLACKILELKSYDPSIYPLSIAITKLKKESELHKTLRHTNIVNEEKVIHVEDLISGFPQPIKVCIFMELCNGDLNSLINASVSGLSEIDAQQWFRDIIFAVKYLHDLDLAHLDIKPPNILYKVLSDGSKLFKLADFGLTYYVPSGPVVYGKCGTPGYVAPEMGTAGGAQPKVCDIYSLGVTLSESLTAGDSMVRMLNSGPLTPRMISHLVNHFHLNEEVIRLVKGMVDVPAHRLTIDDIFQDDWFTVQLV